MIKNKGPRKLELRILDYIKNEIENSPIEVKAGQAFSCLKTGFIRIIFQATEKRRYIFEIETRQI